MIASLFSVRASPIALEAEVVYDCTFDEGPFREPGMGMKFVEIKPEDQTFIKEFIRVDIAAKTARSDRPAKMGFPIHSIGEQKVRQEIVCYCFGYSAEDIRKDCIEAGHSTLLARIIDEKKNGNCNCKTNNPTGR